MRLRDEKEPEVLGGAVDTAVDVESMEAVDEAEDATVEEDQFVPDHRLSIVGLSTAS